ncbi:M24 family metallopeptidase [Metallibacterium scheffleri]
MNTHAREAVGARFDPALLRAARARAWTVLHALRVQMRPGIDEAAAQALASATIAAHGCERLWHRPIIRIGANTTRTFRQASDASVHLAADDGFFIDLGLVFDGHEADVGDSFSIGHAPLQQACAEAARALFIEVADRWRDAGLNGTALYAFAAARAEAMGWRFNHAIKGHRIGDFPHAIHKGGELGNLPATPGAARWILEIQIAHPVLPFGAFYEDLLDT